VLVCGRVSGVVWRWYYFPSDHDTKDGRGVDVGWLVNSHQLAFGTIAQYRRPRGMDGSPTRDISCGGRARTVEEREGESERGGAQGKRKIFCQHPHLT
jgi:hypothetical protein